MTPIEAAIEAVRKQQANIFSADKLARAAVKAYLDAAVTQVASTGVHATEDFFGVSPMAAPTQEVYALRKAAEANNVPSVANVAVNAEGLWGSKTPPGGEVLKYPASLTIQVPPVIKKKTSDPLKVPTWLSLELIEFDLMESGQVLDLDCSVYGKLNEIDSLDLVELIMAAEEEFDILIPDDEADAIRTWRDFVKVIEDRIP